MKRFLFSILWIVVFYLAAALVSGWLIGLFIATGLSADSGDKGLYVSVVVTDIVLLGSVVMAIFLAVRGWLPGTRKRAREQGQTVSESNIAPGIQEPLPGRKNVGNR